MLNTFGKICKKNALRHFFSFSKQQGPYSFCSTTMADNRESRKNYKTNLLLWRQTTSNKQEKQLQNEESHLIKLHAQSLILYRLVTDIRHTVQ